MRKIIYIILSLLVASFVSCHKEYNYTITGKLQNSSDSLAFISFPGQEKMDTIAARDGQFVVKGNADSLTYMTLFIPETGIWLDLWVDKDDKLSISGDVRLPGLLEVRGNAANDKLSAFKEANRALLREKAEFLNQQQEYGADTLLDNSIDLNYTAKISNIDHQLKEKAEEFVKANPSSLASLVLIRDYLIDPDNVERMESSLDQLQAPATESIGYNYLVRMLTKIKRTSIGSPAPDFRIVDMKGDTVSLSDFQGKYLLLTFAASWCDVCRKDNAGLVKAYSRFKGKNMEFFTVSFDEKKEEWSTAAKEDKVNWRQAVDTHGWGAEMLATYNITTIPANFLINGEGIIVDRNLFGDTLETVLETHLE